MSRWSFEPGHTAAEFCARHMMVSWVRGHFKNVHGSMQFDPEDPVNSSIEVRIDAEELWSGDPARDAHLKSADFLDVKNHPAITFKGDQVKLIGLNNFEVTGDLTIRGVRREVTLDVDYLGMWNTPYWVENVDKGPIARTGFIARTKINRHDFGVNWSGPLEKGGVVVGPDVFVTLDVEALPEKD